MNIEEQEKLDIGDFVDNDLFSSPRQVHHLKTNRKGKLMIGVGIEATGFVLAKDCQLIKRKRKSKSS